MAKPRLVITVQWLATRGSRLVYRQIGRPVRASSAAALFKGPVTNMSPSTTMGMVSLLPAPN